MHENPMNRRVCIQISDHPDHFLLARLLGQLYAPGVNPELGTGFDLGADIDMRGRVLPNDHDCQPRGHPQCDQVLHSFSAPGESLSSYFFSV